MMRFSGFRLLLLVTALSGAIALSACSRKSGCPAEDVHVKTDKDGNYKAGKATSGLLPPKASKKRKN